mmetsp:Transcript_76993/g.135745  ORF Transcript_76993/g.135745 Transcript_76993/m.135745 type:complete len:828 (+) Transcript_76993:76-2559(+)
MVSNRLAAASAAATAPLISGIVAMVSAHNEVVSSASPGGSSEGKAGLVWQLPDELFFLGLLSAICSDKVYKGSLKQRSFLALRANEADAARSIQSLWRKHHRSRLEAASSKAAAEALPLPKPLPLGALEPEAVAMEHMATAPKELQAALEPNFEDVGVSLEQLEEIQEKRLAEVQQLKQQLEEVEKMEVSAKPEMEEVLAKPEISLEPEELSELLEPLGEPAEPEKAAEEFPAQAKVAEEKPEEPVEPELPEEMPPEPEQLRDMQQSELQQLWLELQQEQRSWQLQQQSQQLQPQQEKQTPQAEEQEEEAQPQRLQPEAAEPQASRNLKESTRPLPPPLQPEVSSSPVAETADSPVKMKVAPTAPSPRAQRTPRRPPPLGAMIDSPGTPLSTTPLASAGSASLVRPSGQLPSTAASPAASPAGSQQGKCSQSARGENPYRRKWNPRIAAQQRREKEALLLKSNQAARSLETEKTEDKDVAPLAEAAYGEVRHCSNGDPMNAEYIPAKKAGLSLSTPQDRGPEYHPGEREQQRLGAEVAAANAVSLTEEMPARSKPTGQAFVAPPPAASREGATDMGSADLEGMDFGQLQKLISASIATAEAGEDPAAMLEQVSAAESRRTRPQPPASRDAPAGSRFRSSSRRVESPQSPRAPVRNVRPLEEEMAGAADAGASMGAGLSMGAPSEPSRRMAGIRAAAERRAYQSGQVEKTQDSDATLMPPSQPDDNERTLEDPARMSDIRAIAERRAAGFRSSGGARTPGTGTPRAGTPREPSCGRTSEDRDGATRTPTPRGGAYKPNHVYGSRSGTGERSERLSNALGLRFGQPPDR